MWQHRRLCAVVIAGLLGMGLAAGTASGGGAQRRGPGPGERRGGARAADPSLLPSLFALNGLPGRDLTALPCGDAPCTLAGVRGSAADTLAESLRPAWTDAWCSAGGAQDT